MIFDVTILGVSSAIPAHGRHPSGQILNYNHEYFLLDCGEGTQMQLMKFGLKHSRIKHIFISHLHGDHYFGLIGLITSMNLLGREQALHIYSFPQLKDIIQIQLESANLQLRFHLYFHVLHQKPAKILDHANLEILAFPLHHRIPCCGFLIKEKRAERTYLPQRGALYEVPVKAIPSIKAGQDFVLPDGKIIPNAELTENPPPPRSFAYITDTLPLVSLASILKGIDLLYHETTFMKHEIERANETYHSTTEQAALLAKNAMVGKLLIGHFSAKYKELIPLLSEVQEIFKNAILAEEGKTYPIG